MEQSTLFLLQISVILIAANLGGMIAVKLKQSAVLGQIIAGLLLGPSVFGIIGESESITIFSEIGVMFLMFLAGIETDVADLKKSAGSSSLIALGGIIVPYLLGVGAIMLFYKEATSSATIFAGVVLTATSISITVQALRELGAVRSKVGVNILGAAIIDDVLGIIILGFIVGIVKPSEGGSIFALFGKILLFFAIIFVIGFILISLLRKYLRRFSEYVTPVTIATVCCFLIAVIAQEFGLAAIIGAYATGLIFSYIQGEKNHITHDVSTIAYTLFTPVFFSNIGLTVNLQGVSSVIVFSLIFLFVAMIGKVIGCGLGAKLTGFSYKESLQIGIGMIPRGEVALIVANLGKTYGILPDGLFTSAIVVSVGTTIITPFLLKLVFSKKANQ